MFGSEICTGSWNILLLRVTGYQIIRLQIQHMYLTGEVDVWHSPILRPLSKFELARLETLMRRC